MICSNNVVEYTDPTIANAICDFRGFIRFNLTKLNVYSLEFTSSYKIFTLNRSLNDNGTGGYVAITLFVPHAFKVKNVREVLNSLMDAYFKEYVHPLYGTYIGGKFDDIKPFVQLFNNMAQVVRETRKFSVSTSALDNQAQVLLYGNAPEVDEFLDSPYRKEFFQSRKVLFMSRDMYAGIPENLRFERPEKLLDRSAVSAPEPLPVLKIDDPSMVKSLEVNGSPVEYGATPIELADIDTIKVVLHKKYYEDYDLSGEVGQLISQRRGLKRDGSKVIMLRTLDISSELKPKRYTVKLTMNGNPVPEGRVAVSLTRQRRGNVASKNPKTVEKSEFTVSGSELPYCYLCWGLIYKGKSIYDDTVIYSNRLEDVAEAVENGGTIALRTKSYSYAVKVEGNLSVSILKVNVNGVELKFPIKKESEITFDLPEDIDKGSLRFETDEKNAECKAEGDTVRIAPKPVMYKVSIGDYSLGDRVWDFAIDGKSRREGSQSVKVRLRSDERKRGELTIDGLKFDYDVEGNVILPKGYIVNVKGLGSVPVEYDGETHDVYRWRIFPKKPILDRDKYEVKERYEERGGLQILDVRAKRSGTDFAGGSHSHGNQNKHDDFNQDYDDFNFEGRTDRKGSSVKVRLFNCQGGKFKDEAITRNEEYKNLDQSHVIIEVGGKRCKLFKDDRKNVEVAARNTENGFEVAYDGMDTYTVRYNGAGKQPKRGIGDFFRSKLGLIVMISAALLIVAGGVLAAWLMMSNKVETAVACEFEVESSVKDAVPELANIQKVTVPETDKYVKVSKEDSRKVDILLDKKHIDKDCGGSVERYWEDISATQITVDWGPEGQPTYTDHFQLKDLDTSGEIQRYLEKAYKDGVEKESVRVVTVNLMPAVYNSFMEFKEKQVDPALIQNYYNDAHGLYVKYPILKNVLSEMCWGLVDKADAKSVKEYVDGLNFSPLLSEAYKAEAQRLLGDVQAQAEEALQAEAAKAAIQNEVKNQIAKLQSQTCTMEIVKSVQTWYDGLSDENKRQAKNIPEYIKAYTIFFSANSVDDIKALNNKRDYFSSYQKNIIFEGYGKDRSTFNAWYKACGMSFSKPLDYGLTENNGQPKKQ